MADSIPTDVMAAIAVPERFDPTAIRTRDRDRHGMTAAEHIFADHYVRTRDIARAMYAALAEIEGDLVASNKTARGLMAGGRRMLARPAVAKYVEGAESEIRANAIVDREWFAARLLAYSDVSLMDYMEEVLLDKNGKEIPRGNFSIEPKSSYWRPRMGVPPEMWRLIQDIEFTEGGQIKKLKLPDRVKTTIAAAEMLGIKKMPGEEMAEAAGKLTDFLDSVSSTVTNQPLLPGETNTPLVGESVVIDQEPSPS